MIRNTKNLKVLIVCSGNSGRISPFVKEQSEALQKIGVQIHYFLIKGQGVAGYLKNYFPYRKIIKIVKPDIVHAHYGLSGLLACLQRKVPVITTFHGSDIQEKQNLFFSRWAMSLSKENIFVSEKLKKVAKHDKGTVVPCGIDTVVFRPIEQKDSRKLLNLDLNKKYILFSSNFNEPIKNYDLARNAIELLDIDVELIELKGYSRNEVVLLLNSVNVALLTSFNEGSPQFIKEAMACNLPIVATDVGDIKDVIDKTEGCYITSFEPEDVAGKLKTALNLEMRTEGRAKVERLDNRMIALKIVDIYKRMLWENE